MLALEAKPLTNVYFARGKYWLPLINRKGWVFITGESMGFCGLRLGVFIDWNAVPQVSCDKFLFVFSLLLAV